MNIPTLSLRRRNLSISKTRNAFSLIELLVVIAIIGIIAAIAIPNIGGLTAGAKTAKNQRNAQTLASVFSAARAAGNDDSFDTVAAIGTALTTTPGITAGTGANQSSFYVPNLVDPDLTKAEGYLTISGTGKTSQLLYNPGATVAP